MICSHCPNSNYSRAGIPSCFLPHCEKQPEELAKRYAALSAKKKKSDDEWAEYWMIREELGLN